jgi:hypothetical protein
MPPHLRPRAPLVGATLLFALSACAAAPRPAPEDPARAVEPSALPEPAALSLIDRLLLEQRQMAAFGWRVRLAERTDFEVDVRLGESRFGIEWVSAGDRAAAGAVLPEPDPSGQLRVVSALEQSEPALILVLDDRSYRLAGDPRASRAEGERVIEQRLRRDLHDFVVYAQSQ